MTLVECLAATVLAGILTAAAGSLLVSSSRLVRAEAASLSVRQNVRAAAAVLRAELSGIAADSGDLLSVSDSAIAIRAARGFGVLCAAPAGPGVVLDDSLLSLWRSIDPSRDSVRFLAEGDPRSSADDRWAMAAITAVARGPCASGTTGTALTLAGARVALDLSAAARGAPLRIFEVVEYRRYRDGTGAWMLGVRSPAAGGGWAATSPVAGPLLAGSSGLRIRALTVLGAPALLPGETRLVEITLRGVAPRPLPNGVLPRDSLTLTIAVAGTPP